MAGKIRERIGRLAIHAAEHGEVLKSWSDVLDGLHYDEPEAGMKNRVLETRHALSQLRMKLAREIREIDGLVTAIEVAMADPKPQQQSLTDADIEETKRPDVTIGSFQHDDGQLVLRILDDPLVSTPPGDGGIHTVRIDVYEINQVVHAKQKKIGTLRVTS